MVELGLLILLRHGESVLNAQDRFTGLLDAPLTQRGKSQALQAADLLAEARFVPYIVYVSVLTRATQTCDLVLDTLGLADTPRKSAWQLMERNYGALTGRHRAAVFAEYGQQRFLAWRRGRSDKPPPLDEAQLRLLRAQPALAHVPLAGLTATESLSDVIKRVRTLWQVHIACDLRAGMNVLVIAHGNSLRALCAVLDDLTDGELVGLNIPTGEPLQYSFDDNLKPTIRGGSYLAADRAQRAAAAISERGGT